MSISLLIGLSAVILSIEDEKPLFLSTRRNDQASALPFGAFDPATDRTFELALRGWVTAQTGFPLGHVEQLYTFGDRNRETPEADQEAAGEEARLVSVGYLALTPEPATVAAKFCLLYTSPSPRDQRGSRMPSSA